LDFLNFKVSILHLLHVFVISSGKGSTLCIPGRVYYLYRRRCHVSNYILKYADDANSKAAEIVCMYVADIIQQHVDASVIC